MSTRCLTVFKNSGGKEIAVLYRHMDGYPEGHGKELRKFLKGKPITNGIRYGEKEGFNGMECLTASVVSHFKEGIGQFYLYPAGTRDIGEEYIYTVIGKYGDNEAKIKTERG